MLDAVKSSPAGARMGAERATAPGRASAPHQVAAAGAGENVQNDDNRRPGSQSRGDDERARKAAVDRAMKSLLHDAAEAATETGDAKEIENPGLEAPVERHVVVAGLYARHEKSDTRDAVLRPGAVFSATY